jgi:hypothetical protein
VRWEKNAGDAAARGAWRRARWSRARAAAARSAGSDVVEGRAGSGREARVSATRWKDARVAAARAARGGPGRACHDNPPRVIPAPWRREVARVCGGHAAWLTPGRDTAALTTRLIHVGGSDAAPFKVSPNHAAPREGDRNSGTFARRRMRGCRYAARVATARRPRIPQPRHGARVRASSVARRMGIASRSFGRLAARFSSIRAGSETMRTE